MFAGVDRTALAGSHGWPLPAGNGPLDIWPRVRRLRRFGVWEGDQSAVGEVGVQGGAEEEERIQGKPDRQQDRSHAEAEPRDGEVRVVGAGGQERNADGAFELRDAQRSGKGGETSEPVPGLLW